MKKYRYKGNEPVDVDALGLVEVTQNSVVEVPAELAKGFDGRDDWEHLPDPARSKAAKKAAASNDVKES